MRKKLIALVLSAFLIFAPVSGSAQDVAPDLKWHPYVVVVQPDEDGANLFSDLVQEGGYDSEGACGERLGAMVQSMLELLHSQQIKALVISECSTKTLEEMTKNKPLGEQI